LFIYSEINSYYYVEKRQGVAKPLLIIILFTIIVIEFLSLSLFYDMEFNFIVYQPETGSQIHSSLPLYPSPATLIMLKHECFLARVEVHIIPDTHSEIMLLFPDGRAVNLTGEGEYVFTVVLPGEFLLNSYYSAYYANEHYVSTEKPVEVFIEEYGFNNHSKNKSNTFMLANIRVVSGSVVIKVKVWGVML